MVNFSFRVEEEDKEKIKALQNAGFNVSQLLRKKMVEEYKKLGVDKNDVQTKQ